MELWKTLLICPPTAKLGMYAIAHNSKIMMKNITAKAGPTLKIVQKGELQRPEHKVIVTIT
jgi:hypothetical protein